MRPTRLGSGSDAANSRLQTTALQTTTTKTRREAAPRAAGSVSAQAQTGPPHGACPAHHNQVVGAFWARRGPKRLRSAQGYPASAPPSRRERGDSRQKSSAVTTRATDWRLGSAAIKRSQFRGLSDRPRTSSFDQTRASPKSNLGVQWLCPCHPRCLHGFRLLPVAALPPAFLLQDPRAA